MDFPVEATVHLSNFPNQKEARDILWSHGLTLTDLSSDQVHVKGSFFNLRAAKASLEPLLIPQTRTDIRPSASSPVSSGNVSDSRTYSSSTGRRSRSESRNKPPYASQSLPTTSPYWATGSSNDQQTSPENRASFSARPDQRGSLRRARESFVVDSDVFEYAYRLRKKEIDDILRSHNVDMDVDPVSDSCTVTLQGKNARIAVSKLQSLLNELNKSLRTQEVSLKDMDRDGRALLQHIQRNRDVSMSVLVCQKDDKLYLIGPSGESYQLKQKLLGRPVDPPGRTGRTMDRNLKKRSSSLPPNSRMNTGRDSGAVNNPVGATGYSPSKYQDDKQDGAKWTSGSPSRTGSLRRKSHSETRQKAQAGRANGHVQDTENKHPSPKSPMQNFKQLMHINPQNIKQMFKSKRK